MDRNYYRSQWKVPIMNKNQKHLCVVCGGVCVRACIWACNIVSRHPSPDSTPNWKSSFIDPKQLYFLQECLSWSKCPPLTDATFYSASCILLCLSMHLSLSIFFISPCLSLCRLCIRARGGLADLQLSTGRRWEMYLHSVAPAQNMCNRDHAADSSVSLWRRWHSSLTCTIT